MRYYQFDLLIFTKTGMITVVEKIEESFFNLQIGKVAIH